MTNARVKTASIDCMVIAVVSQGLGIIIDKFDFLSTIGGGGGVMHLFLYCTVFIVESQSSRTRTAAAFIYT